MKERICHILAAAGLMLACIAVFTGCGGKDDGGKHILETAACTKLDIPGDVDYDIITGMGTVFYACWRDVDAGILHGYRKDLNSSDPSAEFELAFGDDKASLMYPERFNVDAEGNMYVYWVVEEEKVERHQFLCKYAEDGRELMRKTLEIPGGGTTTDMKNAIKNIVVDGEGRVCLVCYGNLFFYDRNLEYQGMAEELDVSARDDIYASGIGRDGKLYFTKTVLDTFDEWKLVEVDPKARETGAVYEGYPAVRRRPSDEYVCPGVWHDFLIGSNTALYGYRMEDQATETLLMWMDLDISGQDVQYFCQLEDGDILVVEQSVVGADKLDPGLAREMRLFRLSETEAEAPGKEVITLGVTGNVLTNEKLQQKALQFNKAQDTYRVELKIYEGTDDYNSISGIAENKEALQAMNLDLVSGNGPDLIVYNGNFPFYAQKGILEDLNGYLEKSEILSREDYLETALQMFTFYDRLTTLPTYFAIQTVYGYADQVGEEKGLDLDQFLELGSNYPQMPLLDCESADTLLIRLCAPAVMTFVDMDAGTCSFESKGFGRLLEFVRDSPKVDLHLEMDWREREDPVLGRDYLLRYTEITGMRGVMEIRALERPVTLVGYPTGDGKGTCLYAYTNFDSIGISSASPHKEGAWAFLEYLYGTMGERNYALTGFPARISSLEKYLKGEIGEVYEIDGVEYTVTEEDIAFFRELLQDAVPNSVNLYGNTICDIVLDEAQGFLEGDKTVQNVTDAIQSRVRVYLNETY